MLPHPHACAPGAILARPSSVSHIQSSTPRSDVTDGSSSLTRTFGRSQLLRQLGYNGSAHLVYPSVDTQVRAWRGLMTSLTVLDIAKHFQVVYCWACMYCCLVHFYVNVCVCVCICARVLHVRQHVMHAPRTLTVSHLAHRAANN